MQNIAKIYDRQPLDRFLGKARFMKTGRHTGQVIAAPVDGKPVKEITARLAVHLNQELLSNDELLIIEDNIGDFYVIGVLSQHRDFQSAPTVLKDGTYAIVRTDGNKQKLGVYANNNNLLFEYDPETKKAKIFSDAENVIFEAPKGNMEFKAAGSIHLKGHQVALTGKFGINLSVGQIFEKIRSGLSINPGKIDVSSREIKVSSRRVGVYLEEVRNNIKTMISKMGSARLTVDKLETTAASIIEKTETAYRTIAKLNQVKAGRMRMLIHQTFHLGSKTSVIKAKDDVKVKGEKIHLG